MTGQDQDMSYADVSLAASSSQAVSTPLYAGTTFNFGGSGRGDMNYLENNPILPSTATSTKATNGNAVSDTRVPITADAIERSSLDWKPIAVVVAVGVGLLILNKKFGLL